MVIFISVIKDPEHYTTHYKEKSMLRGLPETMEADGLQMALNELLSACSMNPTAESALCVAETPQVMETGLGLLGVTAYLALDALLTWAGRSQVSLGLQ
jgi:hypothetical protein